MPRASEPLSLRSLWAASSSSWRDRVILGTISLDMCAVFLGGAGALFPVFARDILQTGPWGLGLLRAAPAVGAFAMSLVLARRPLTLPIGHVLFGVITVFGLATIVFALSTHSPPVAGGARGAGRRRCGQRGDPLFAGAAAHAGRDARPRQRGERHVHRHLELSRRFPRRRGRGAIGAVPAVVIGGVGVFVVAALWLFLFPQFRRIRTLDEVSAAQAERSRGARQP